jgi:diphthine-ammonia ligase
MVIVCRDQGLKYNVTAGDEVEDMFALLSEVKRKIPSISAVSSGAIASDYQRLRVENVCSRLGLVSLAYLWKQDQTLLLEEMVPSKLFYFLFLLVVCTSRKRRTRNVH